MEVKSNDEEYEKRIKWMEKRTKQRFEKKLKCEDVYSRSRSSSPEVYRELLDRYRNLHEDSKNEVILSENDNDEWPVDCSEETHEVKDYQKYSFHDKEDSESSSSEDYGPQPLKINPSLEMKINYGVELLPGEGDAMAKYIQKGKRIPRRGEVGLTGEQIENFEKIGYVMSGSRHKAINAMRIKKESMVLSAEQERAQALEKYQSKLNRENEIVNNFREMLRKKQEESEKD